jgi:hypothetical protein
MHQETLPHPPQPLPTFAARDAFRYRQVRAIIARSWTGKAIDARICFAVDRATGAQSWLHGRSLVIGYRGMAQTRILLSMCKGKASVEGLDGDNALPSAGIRSMPLQPCCIRHGRRYPAVL